MNELLRSRGAHTAVGTGVCVDWYGRHLKAKTNEI